MSNTPQPDAAKMTPTPERFERDHWLPLYVDDCENYIHSANTLSEGYHHIDGGRGFYHKDKPESGIGFSGVMSKEQADYIATACNSHARLLAENAALVKALERIEALEDAPEIDATGDVQFGLHCGVEDRDCSNRYEGADFGFTRGIEKALEWAANEAQAALALHQSGKEGKRS